MAPVHKKKHLPKGVKKAGGKKKKQSLKFNIECKNPVEDGIMNVSDFEVFLNERIKVNGKLGQMAANGVRIELQKTKLVLTSEFPSGFSNRFSLVEHQASEFVGCDPGPPRHRMSTRVAPSGCPGSAAYSLSSHSANGAIIVPFSKRYLKYLTKKYLKRNSLRDWLRVVASTKDTYELRYFQISQDDEDVSDNES
ncbi:unnamed protein product [Anisakis simplex]|uniref:Large ribosomal subunit protein eL22 n=1 Tax=Anisakis simplex TaxID=6269 RepID=A0A0M3K336_ANISI|nr:unnamed protein product [Anisakis simplex]